MCVCVRVRVCLQWDASKPESVNKQPLFALMSWDTRLTSLVQGRARTHTGTGFPAFFCFIAPRMRKDYARM